MVRRRIPKVNFRFYLCRHWCRSGQFFKEIIFSGKRNINSFPDFQLDIYRLSLHYQGVSTSLERRVAGIYRFSAGKWDITELDLANIASCCLQPAVPVRRDNF